MQIKRLREFVYQKQMHMSDKPIYTTCNSGDVLRVYMNLYGVDSFFLQYCFLKKSNLNYFLKMSILILYAYFYSLTFKK